jgi:hypothetical protein
MSYQDLRFHLSFCVGALALLLFCANLLAFELNAEICADLGLATGTEQRNLGAGATLAEKLNENPESILQITVQKYVPWKDMAVEPDPVNHGCFRNWKTRFYVRYLALREGNDGEAHSCEVSLVGQMYSDYVGVAGGNEAKVRVLSEVCTLVSDSLAARIGHCMTRAEQGGGCRSQNGVPTYPDVFAGCECKTFDQLVVFDNLQPRYEDFFTPGRFESRPAHVVPFDGLLENSYDDLKELRQAIGHDLF